MQQVQYQEGSLVYKFLNDPNLLRTLQGMNLSDLKLLGDEFQKTQHDIMLSINPADKEAAALAIAVCRGANDFIYWVGAMRQELINSEMAEQQRVQEANE